MVDSRLSKWYAGSALFCPAHNNACEGTNRWVKETHTKRSLQSISRFLKLLFDMVRNWSLDRVQNKMFKFINSIQIPDNNWRMAYALLFSETEGHTKQIDASNVYKLTRGNVGCFDVKQFEIKNLKAVFHYSDNVSEVSLNSQERAKSTYTCCFFLKFITVITS